MLELLAHVYTGKHLGGGAKCSLLIFPKGPLVHSRTLGKRAGKPSQAAVMDATGRLARGCNSMKRNLSSEQGVSCLTEAPPSLESVPGRTARKTQGL